MERLEWGNRNISVVDLRIYLICFSVQYGARKTLLFRVSGISAIQNLDLITAHSITCPDPLCLCDTNQALFPAFFLLLELYQTYDAARGQGWTFPNDYTIKT